MANLLEQIHDLQKENKALQERNKTLTHELLWILVEVWPLVHGLTSRQCIRNRFAKLRDVINPPKVKE